MDHGIWHDLIHGAAAAVLVVGGAVLLLLAARERRRSPQPAARPRPTADGAPTSASLYAGLGAALAAAAGLIHLAAAPSHVESLGLLGWGFVLVAMLQGTWALSWAIQPSRGMAIAGIAMSLAIVAAWAVSRTAGLPVGPQPGVPEAPGAADVTATGLELALVAVLGLRVGRLAPRIERLLRASPALPSLAVVPVLGTVALATTIAVVAALGHDHAAGEGHGHAAPVERAVTER